MNKVNGLSAIALVLMLMLSGTAMANGAGVVAQAWGSANTEDSASATTSASVTYNGALTHGNAYVTSTANGEDAAGSVSAAGGYVISWQEASIYGATYAYADDSEVSANGNTNGATNDWLLPLYMTTHVEMQANGDSEAGVVVTTEASIYDSSIYSTGFAGASDSSVDGYSIATGSNGVMVDAGSQVNIPGEEFDVEAFNWAEAYVYYD